MNFPNACLMEDSRTIFMLTLKAMTHTKRTLKMDSVILEPLISLYLRALPLKGVLYEDALLRQVLFSKVHLVW